MGANCCGNSYNIIGEEFVKRVLKDESLKLKTYDYIRLLNSVADIRVQQEIFKVHIDEYLIPRDGADCRSLLNNITDDVISLNWIEHELVDMEHERDVFLLNRLCNRSSKVNVMTKIFLKGSFVQNNNIRLIQGNHGVMKLAENDSESF